MTGFLASVRTPLEADIALQAGATLIDAKNPHQGALGALSMAVISAILETVDHQAPVSATVGDLALDDPVLAERILALDQAGIDYIKIGLFKPKAGTLESALQALPIPQRAKRIAVILVDEAPMDQMTPEGLKALGFDGVMLDTAQKNSPGLRGVLDHHDLSAFVEASKAANLLTGLAGRLRLEDVEPLLSLSPDYLGFRSALCQAQNRSLGLDARACAQIRSALFAPLGATDQSDLTAEMCAVSRK